MAIHCINSRNLLDCFAALAMTNGELFRASYRAASTKYWSIAKLNSIEQQKLQAAIRECATHLKRMTYACNNLIDILPLNQSSLSSLNDQQITLLDQYIYRFTKLQDAMGQRLFKYSLTVLQEDAHSMAFIDQLNRMEQLGILQSAHEWQELRQLRNLLAHEYEDNQELRAALINQALDSCAIISCVFTNVKNHMQPYLAPSNLVEKRP